MNKTFKIYGIILLVVLVLIALLEVNKTKVIDWSKNYRLDSKEPFGLYVFDKEAKKIFGKNLEKSQYSPYNFYTDKANAPHNILLISKDIDGESWKKILKQVKNGSDAFIMKEHFYYSELDTLGLEYEYFSSSEFDLEEEAENIMQGKNPIIDLYFTDKKLSTIKTSIDKKNNNLYFSGMKKESQILGYAQMKDVKKGVNFVKVKFGKGNFYLHTEPLVFTNYYLLKKNGQAYPEALLSYLPNRKTIWFVDDLEVSSSSPMRFILSKPALKYAWWLFLGSVLLFILFNIKRKQRVVPIIEPKKNKSVEFVKSIGNLYLNEGDFRDMMTKKSQYFLSRVRMELLVDTQHLDERFIKMLHLKTGKSVEKITQAVTLIQKAQDPYSFVTKEDLVQMNTILDEIYN